MTRWEKMSERKTGYQREREREREEKEREAGLRHKRGGKERL